MTTTTDTLTSSPIPSAGGGRAGGSADLQVLERGAGRRALIETGELVRRSIVHLLREPGELIGTLLFPIISVLLFGYVFGSAIAVPGGGDYRSYLMPGLFGMTMMFGVANTALYIVTDLSRGVTDRFRAMPLARGSVLLGRAGADTTLACVDLVFLMGMGMVVGWRAEEGLLPALAAVGLLLWLRFAMTWAGIWLGLLIRTPETAMKAFGMIMPLAMLSNAFVAPELMPGWLQVVAEWNPLSSTVSAARELFGNAPPMPVEGGSWIARNAVPAAVVLPAAITAVAMPAAMRRFHRLSR